MKKISRRHFLEFAGISAGSVVAGTALRTSTAHASNDTFSGHPDRKGLLIDTTLCIGCRTCEASCNKANNLPQPAVPFTDRSVLQQKRRTSAEAYTVVNQYNPTPDGKPIYRKQQCMHCEEPACASVCLVAAMKKTPEGPVVYNKDVCMGCRYCIMACPYSMPAYEYGNATSPRVMKCSMCFDRVKEGKMTACAETCPVKAILFGKRDDLLKIAKERIVSYPDKYINYIYGEHEAGGAGVLYLASVPFDKLGLPTNLSTTPYPELSRDFLTSVPLVLMGWPALFLGLNAFAKRREQAARSNEQASPDDRSDE